MTRDELYTLAHLYKLCGLSAAIFTSQIFAVKFDDGRVGYLTTAGLTHSEICLSLFMGDHGLQCLRYLLSKRPNRHSGEIDVAYFFSSQDFLECSFEKKEDLSKKELKAARDFAKSRGLSLRQKYPYARFTKYRQGRFASTMTDEKDLERMGVALEAAIAMLRLIRHKGEDYVGFRFGKNKPLRVPMLVKKNGEWVNTMKRIPPVGPMFKPVKFEDELMLARLTQKRKHGTFICGTTFIPMAISLDGKKEGEMILNILMSLDAGTGVLGPNARGTIETLDREQRDFIAAMSERTYLPEKICVRDDLCEALLSDFCDKVGIEMTREGDFETLEMYLQEEIDIAKNPSGHMSTSHDIERLETAITEDQFDWTSLPTYIGEYLKSVAAAGLLSEAATEKIRAVLGE